MCRLTNRVAPLERHGEDNSINVSLTIRGQQRQPHKSPYIHVTAYLRPTAMGVHIHRQTDRRTPFCRRQAAGVSAARCVEKINVRAPRSLECVGLCRGGTCIGTYVIPAVPSPSFSIVQKNLISTMIPPPLTVFDP